MLHRLLLPTTDLGVVLQVAVLVVALVGAWRLSHVHLVAEVRTCPQDLVDH